MDQGICGFPSKLSHEAFPRGFPTGLSHVPPWCESILGFNVEAVQGSRFPWNGLSHWGTLGMVSRPCSSCRLSCVECLLLRCDGNAGNSCPTLQGKDPSSQAKRRKRGSSGCGWDSRASSRVEPGMSGNFLRCSKGVKDLWKFQRLGVSSLETPQRKWASSRLEGRTSWIFSSWGRCSRLRSGTSGTRSGGLRKDQSPCELLGGL